MKLISKVESTLDFDILNDVIKKNACEGELPRIRRWVKRLKKEGPNFLNKRIRMSEKVYQSVYFARFGYFVSMATIKTRRSWKMVETDSKIENVI